MLKFLARVGDLPGEGFGVNQQIARHWRRFLYFGLVGATGVLVNMAMLYIFVDAIGWNYLVASPVATEAAILSNFALNNVWTFRSARTTRSVQHRLWRYNLIALGGLGITVGVLAGLTHFLGLHYLVANMCGIGIATIWNYTLNSKFTWGLAQP